MSNASGQPTGKTLRGKTSFKQRAYQTLQRILAGQYVPGELLNRRGGATGLKMSTAPVHEAMLICGLTVARHVKQLTPLDEALDALDPRDPRTAQKEMAFHCALVERADSPALLLEYRRIMNID